MSNATRENGQNWADAPGVRPYEVHAAGRDRRLRVKVDGRKYSVDQSEAEAVETFLQSMKTARDTGDASWFGEDRAGAQNYARHEGHATWCDRAEHARVATNSPALPSDASAGPSTPPLAVVTSAAGGGARRAPMNRRSPRSGISSSATSRSANC